MNSFDSTFEALALHYAGFGLFAVVNNVWTIVALVTAALSFWRLRSVSLPFPLPSDRLLASPPERFSTSAAIDSRPSSSSLPDSADEAATAIPVSPKVAAAPSGCDGGVLTKGRFVAYYREDGRCDAAVAVAAAAAATGDDEQEELEPSIDRSCCGGGVGEWWAGWEKALRLRTSGVERGTGWYDYQDRAVLSGSVVRLWEEERRELVVTPSMTSAGRCCVVW